MLRGKTCFQLFQLSFQSQAFLHQPAVNGLALLQPLLHKFSGPVFGSDWKAAHMDILLRVRQPGVRLWYFDNFPIPSRQ